MTGLRDRLASPEILLAPGVFDALTASLAEAAGFEAVYLSGATVAYTRLGRPDIGLTTMSEMADTLALIRDRVNAPIVVDADTGFGNALNAERTMRVYERMGAAALQLEIGASRASVRETVPIAVRVVDAHGVQVSSWSGEVRLALSGPARLNSHTPDHRVLVARGEGRSFFTGLGAAGEIEIEARGTELAPARAQCRLEESEDWG